MGIGNCIEVEVTLSGISGEVITPLTTNNTAEIELTSTSADITSPTGAVCATVTFAGGENSSTVAPATFTTSAPGLDCAQLGGAGTITISTIDGKCTISGAASATALPIKDEGGQLTSAVSSINFVGEGVTATNVGSDVTVTVPKIQAINCDVGSGIYSGEHDSKFKFRSIIGTGNVIVTGLDGNDCTLVISGSGGGSDIIVKDEGVELTSAAKSFDFVGAGVTATQSSNNVTITIPGGGGGSNQTATNIGYGSGIYSGTIGDEFQLRSISGVSGIAITGSGDNTIIISGQTGNFLTGASNIGSGSGIYSGRMGNDLKFKSLHGLGNVEISGDSGNLYIGSYITGTIGCATTLGSGIAMLSGVSRSTNYDLSHGDVVLHIQSDESCPTCDFEGQKTIFTDSSSYSHTITRNGDPEHSTAQAKFGTTSIYFDGAGDYLSIPNSPNLDFGKDDFTIEMWLRPDDGRIGGLFSAASSVGGGSTKWGFVTRGSAGGHGAGDDQHCRVQWWDQLYGYSQTAYFGHIIPPLQWTHVAVVRDNEVIKLFIGGQLKSSHPPANPVNGTKDLSDDTLGTVIGRFYVNSDDYYFKGYMDEIRVSKNARYKGSFTPSSTTFGKTSSISSAGKATTLECIELKSFSGLGNIFISGDNEHVYISGGANNIGTGSGIYSGIETGSFTEGSTPQFKFRSLLGTGNVYITGGINDNDEHVYISGSGVKVEVKDEGALVENETTSFNFIGDGVQASSPSKGVVNITVPGASVFTAEAGTGAGFFAYRTTEASISTDTYTDLSANAKEFDLRGDYNTSTYRFIPTVSGKYLIQAQARFDGGFNAGEYAELIVSGDSVGRIAESTVADTRNHPEDLSLDVSRIIESPATGEYYQVFVYNDDNDARTLRSGIHNTYFAAHIFAQPTPISGVANIGHGTGIASGITGGILQMRSISGVSGVKITGVGNHTVVVSGQTGDFVDKRETGRFIIDGNDICVGESTHDGPHHGSGVFSGVKDNVMQFRGLVGTGGAGENDGKVFVTGIAGNDECIFISGSGFGGGGGGGDVTWVDPPPYKNAPGKRGQIAFDWNYFYICVTGHGSAADQTAGLTGEWRRTAISEW